MNLSIVNHVKSASAGSDSVCFSGATLAVASNTIPPGIRMNTEIPLFGCFILLVALEICPWSEFALGPGVSFWGRGWILCLQCKKQMEHVGPKADQNHQDVGPNM